MSPLIATIVVALEIFIISIFGASWLYQRAMNKRIDDLRNYLDMRFSSIEQTMNVGFDAVDARFDELMRASSPRRSDQQSCATRQKDRASTRLYIQARSTRT
jgi:hypothetical protein